jgi:pyruvate/2-oxoglutarate dehydrogenase complex dihydrolipoamide acyltransferase (E2) component
MADDDRNFWRMTSIGLVIGAIVAVVTGIVVTNRTGPGDTRLVAPSASPATTVDDATVSQPRIAQTPEPTPAPSKTAKGVPPQSVVAECNRVAASMSGRERTRDEKIPNAAKDVAAGTLYGIYDNKKHDERYRSAYIGCMKSKGYTA